jgi:hypothetical protein
MAISWNYNADDYKENDFAPIPVGDHRVRIANVEEKKSQNSNDMLVLTLDVSGHSGSLWFYLVFMPNNPQITNQRLGQIFDSFGIQPNNMNFSSWIGKVGGARVKHEQYNGETSAKVNYFLSRSKVDALPAWQESAGKASVTGGGSTMTEVKDDDLPF